MVVLNNGRWQWDVGGRQDVPLLPYTNRTIATSFETVPLLVKVLAIIKLVINDKG
jgi:hypothetical protein